MAKSINQKIHKWNGALPGIGQPLPPQKQSLLRHVSAGYVGQDIKSPPDMLPWKKAHQNNVNQILISDEYTLPGMGKCYGIVRTIAAE